MDAAATDRHVQTALRLSHIQHTAQRAERNSDSKLKPSIGPKLARLSTATDDCSHDCKALNQTTSVKFSRRYCWYVDAVLGAWWKVRASLLQ